MSGRIKLLRLYIDESAHLGNREVLEVVASRARGAKLAGAAVVQELFGLGRSAHQHRRPILEDDQWLTIEIVDDENPAPQVRATARRYLGDQPDHSGGARGRGKCAGDRRRRGTDQMMTFGRPLAGLDNTR